MEIAGLKSICFGSSFMETLIPIGLRKSASLTISPFKEIEDYRHRKHRNYLNFKIEAECIQPSMQILKKVLDNESFYVQAVTAQGEVFQIPNMGLDFEMVYSSEGRSLKLVFQICFPYSDGLDLIDAAKDNTDLHSTNFEDASKYYPSAWSNNSGLGIAPLHIMSKKLSIKPEGVTNIANALLPNYWTINYEIVTVDSSMDFLLTHFTPTNDLTLTFEETNEIFAPDAIPPRTYDKLIFSAGVLTKQSEFTVSEDERTTKLVLAARIPLSKISFAFGTNNGCKTGDTVGATGGTITFSL